jgi:hypothetical protein
MKSLQKDQVLSVIFYRNTLNFEKIYVPHRCTPFRKNLYLTCTPFGTFCTPFETLSDGNPALLWQRQNWWSENLLIKNNENLDPKR